jgi:DNA repair protein RadC
VPIGYCARKRRFNLQSSLHIEQSSMRPHVALAHNHPSGVAEPSRADELLTQTLKQALSLVEIKTLDHFIVAGTKTISFAERGLL